jgi:hypothetical protein
MKTIWKATLLGTDIQEIEVPDGSRILCAREQAEQVCIWFICDPDAAKVKRTILIFGTGHEAPADADANYLGSTILHHGALVLHVFEKL